MNREKLSFYSGLQRRFRDAIDLETCRERFLAERPEEAGELPETVFDTVAGVLAPLALSYVRFVLEDAQRRKLRRLYFCARDGYLLVKAARVLCRMMKLSIDCRYLYVSRHALWGPLYGLDKSGALDRFCLPGARVDIRRVLARAGIPEELYAPIAAKLNLEPGKYLQEAELQELKSRLAAIPEFDEEASRSAAARLRETIGYFRQEGLLEPEGEAGFVDVGWGGSLQHCFTQILQAAGGTPMRGYYFALFYEIPPEDGEASAFYFSAHSHPIRQLLICVDLLECLFGAPHGMTLGYRRTETDGRYEPLLREFRKQELTLLQHEFFERYLAIFETCGDPRGTDTAAARLAEKLLVSFAVFPSREEAETYGSFQFCDDIAENYFLPLAERFTPAEIRQHGFLRKLLRRLKRGEAATPIRHSYWIHGSIALSGVRNRRLYHYEAVLNELLFRLRKKLH